ncbi:maleate cis-trans isomerase family protein [Solicola gregarius]|uniref:Maleate cis-trans isomerase n=1 Tax=Solicola gregarius TaxID=2908642 RepID=A0AA46YKA2_9ACTN|nr:maleate cis-trans isomerase [Solicola gregarius]UYM03778.1 maleate cis-trans isomerase [Solicola gregarius]
MKNRPTIGLLYPGYSAEDDYPALEQRLDGAVRLPLVHTSVGEDAHRVDALLDLGSAPRLAEGAKALSQYEPDAVMWACTSGSFVFGWDGAHEQVDGIAAELDVPVSSTSIAFADAIAHLGLTKVAVAASYPEDVATHFVDFMRKGGTDVLTMRSNGIITAAEVGTLGKDAVVSMIHAADVPEAEAVLVPDTAMHSLAWLDDLEEAAGKVVLTANQVTVWKGLDLIGDVPPLDGLGTLFRR